MRAEGYFRLEWKLAIDRSHLMAQDRPFLIPVVIDDTHEGDERVPDKFREVQWTRSPNGATTEAFVQKWLHPSADLADFEPLYDGLRLAGVSN